MRPAESEFSGIDGENAVFQELCGFLRKHLPFLNYLETFANTEQTGSFGITGTIAVKQQSQSYHDRTVFQKTRGLKNFTSSAFYVECAYAAAASSDSASFCGLRFLKVGCHKKFVRILVNLLEMKK